MIHKLLAGKGKMKRGLSLLLCLALLGSTAMSVSVLADDEVETTVTEAASDVGTQGADSENLSEDVNTDSEDTSDGGTLVISLSDDTDTDEQSSDTDDTSDTDSNDGISLTAVGDHDHQQGTAGVDYSFEHIDVRVNTGSFSITQTVTESTTQSITVNKEWTDSASADHSSDEVVVYLVNSNGTAVDLNEDGTADYIATLNEENNWTYTWENLTLSAGDYDVAEIAVKGYTATTSGSFEIEDAESATSSSTISGTLTLTGIQNSITITHPNEDGTTKTYTHSISTTPTSNIGQDGAEYQTGSLQNGVELYIGDTITIKVSFTLVYTINGKEYKKEYTDYEFSIVAGKKYAEGGNNLCGASGFDFEVTVNELASDVFNSVVEYETIVTNTPTTIDIPVEKKWTNDENFTSLRSAITLTLCAQNEGENEITEVSSVVLGEDDVWTYTFENMPEYDLKGGAANAKLITYTVKETSSPEYYTNEVTGDETTGYIVTNTLNTVDVTIKKYVTGNMGDKTKEFTISYTSDVTDDGSKDLKDYTTNSDDDNVITLTLPVGSTITLTETGNDGYDAPVVKYGNNAVTANNDGSYTITLESGVTEIAITNNYDIDPDTGISLDSAPYILMLAGVAILGGVVLFRRRRKLL